MVAMKRALITSTFREIRHTLSRFLSIFAIVALGTGFLAGIKATAPDMILSIDSYFDQTRLADLRLVSTMGFDDDDVAAIRDAQGVNGVMPSYTADVFAYQDDKQLLLRLHSMPLGAAEDENLLNRPVLLEGRMPLRSGECLAEASGNMTSGYRVGDVITVEAGGGDPIEDMLAVTQFTVVGTVRSPYYISFDRGTSSIGTGTVDRFLYVPEQDFTYSVYTDVFVTLDGALQQQSYAQGYTDMVDMQVELLEPVADNRERDRYDKIIAEATEELDEARRELANAEEEALRELDDAQKEIDDARGELEDGEREYRDAKNTFDTEIADAQRQLDDGYKELREGRQAYRDGLAQYNSKSKAAYEELDAAKAQIAAGLAQYEQGLATYQNGAAAHTALTDAFGIMQSPDATPEQQMMALGTIAAIAAEFSGNEETAQLAQVLTLFAAEPENPENTYMMQMSLDGFGQTLAGTKLMLDEAKAELDAGQRQVSAGYAALARASIQLESARQQLEEAQKTLDENQAEFEEAKAEGERELADARREIDDGWKKLAEGKEEYANAKADALRELADAQVKIDDAQAEIDDLTPPEWYILTRESIPGNSGYYEDSKRVDAVAKVFPVFFFLVAALVCLTTMTRMVEEKRTELGTIKALGYGKGAAVFKFLCYAGIASLLGSAAGLAIGFKVFPSVIAAAYGMLYQTPAVQTPFHLSYAVPITLIAVLVTMMSAFLACYKELAEQPAALMRPKAPKPGKRVLLERIPFLWKRLGFIQKVTVRNLLRYKRRMLMTVIGIAGCTALMLAGFGLRNSISSITTKQYGAIFLYHGMLLLDQEAAAEDKAQLSATVLQQDNITGSLQARQDSITALDADGNVEVEAALFVPENHQNIGDYAVLRTRDGHEGITLDGDGAVVTEKLAKLLEIKIGDTLILRDSDNRPHEVMVAAITENYVYHYIYLSRTQYEQVFDKAFEPNTLFMRLADASDNAQDTLSKTLISNDYVVSVSYNSAAEKGFQDALESLDYVVLVLIISAGLLAFVVLYNLTNINVTERIREIATIKVLGFYNREVSAYIYRENIFHTLMGIVFGLFAGIFLHRFVMQAAEVDVVMFGREIGWFAYLMSAVLTMVFALLVNITLHFRLKKVSMVESLKSVE